MKTTLLCYQVNKGNCRNKVSRENKFICAAGHGKGGRYYFAPDDNPNAMITSLMSPDGQRQGRFALSALEEREELAASVGLSRSQQLQLAEDTSEWVRLSLSKNVAVSEESQFLLARDNNLWVRVNLAWNPNLSPSVRDVLRKDSNPTVQMAISKRAEAEAKVRSEADVIDIDKIGKSASESHPQGKSILDQVNLEDFFLEQSLVIKNDKELAEKFLNQLIGMANNNMVKGHKQIKAALVYAFSSYAEGSSPLQDKKLYLDKIMQSFPQDNELSKALGGVFLGKES